MEVEAAEGGDGDGAGTSAPAARHAGAWNRHDDAAVAGILAAARAAGASGASVRYGGVVTKIWFEPQGEEQVEVKEKVKKLQLATAQQRLNPSSYAKSRSFAIARDHARVGAWQRAIYS